jgi:hypothetical protein
MNIIELVDQAGLDWQRGWTFDDNEPNRFSVFAELVAAHEREECAKLCDEMYDDSVDGYPNWQYGAAIRARSKA